MKQRTSQILFAYWNDVRGERAAPRRFEIEPSRISSILSETCIIEYGNDEAYRFRLAGTRICEQFGTEFRGRDLLDGWSAGDRETLEHHLREIRRQSSVSVFTVGASAADGREARFEMILLPLVHTDGRIDRFLASITAIDPPHWLGTAPLVARHLTTADSLWPDGRPHAFLERNHHQAPFLPQPPGTRIVRSDRRQFRVYPGGRES
jgi:hypothetical protein